MTIINNVLTDVTQNDISDRYHFIVPEFVTEIADNAFRNCFRLEKIIIPENVEVINGDAFKGCKKLKYVENRSDVSITGLDEDVILIYKKDTLDYALSILNNTINQIKVLICDDDSDETIGNIVIPLDRLNFELEELNSIYNELLL